MSHRVLLLSALAVVLLPAGMAARQRDSGDTKSTAPDNTKVNKGDQNGNAPTADRQSENSADLQLAQKIRRSITQDKSLSTYGHNVKVITQNGEVTLKGPVKTEAEKQSIKSKAIEIAGTGHVDDQMAVTPANQNKDSKEQ